MTVPQPGQIVVRLAGNPTTGYLWAVTAIEGDPNFRGGDFYGGPHPNLGLALARRIAHKTFVSLETLRERARSEVVSPWRKRFFEQRLAGLEERPRPGRRRPFSP